jgi:hypothetical protein
VNAQQIRRFTAASPAILVLLLASAAAPSADQDVDLMAKWTSATVVRYHVIAEFAGEPVILQVGGGVTGRATVTDRFEAEFDWNATEYQLVGKPIIRNFPSKLVSLPAGCPMTVSGPFEHTTVTALVNDDTLRYANAVRAVVERQLPAGTFAMRNEYGPCALVQQIAAQTVRTQIALPAPPGMMLGMPSAAGGYQHNGKAFIIKDGNTETRGWTYTVTPTIVK